MSHCRSIMDHPEFFGSKSCSKKLQTVSGLITWLQFSEIHLSRSYQVLGDVFIPLMEPFGPLFCPPIMWLKNEAKPPSINININNFSLHLAQVDQRSQGLPNVILLGQQRAPLEIAWNGLCSLQMFQLSQQIEAFLHRKCQRNIHLTSIFANILEVNQVQVNQQFLNNMHLAWVSSSKKMLRACLRSWNCLAKRWDSAGCGAVAAWSNL